MSEQDDIAARRERVSALVDGQLRGEEFARTTESGVHDPDARAAWHVYHVVGDVLRFGAMSGCAADRGFSARFAARLAQEAPPERPSVTASTIENVAEKAGGTSAKTGKVNEYRSISAANGPVFRWKMAAGFASVVAIGAIGWNLVGGISALPDAARLALVAPQAQPGAVAINTDPARAVASSLLARNAEPPQMIRDPRLDELLAAHEQSGGVSALQMPAGFLRNATFEGRVR